MLLPAPQKQKRAHLSKVRPDGRQYGTSRAGCTPCGHSTSVSHTAHLSYHVPTRSVKGFPLLPVHQTPSRILQRVIHNFHKVFHTLYPLVCNDYRIFSNINQDRKWYFSTLLKRLVGVSDFSVPTLRPGFATQGALTGSQLSPGGSRIANPPISTPYEIRGAKRHTRILHSSFLIIHCPFLPAKQAKKDWPPPREASLKMCYVRPSPP